MIPHKKLVITSLYASLLLFFTSAQALTVTYSDNWSTSRSVNTGANSTASRTDSLTDTDTLAVSLFDPTLGILNSVRVILDNMSLTSSAGANFRDSDAFNETAGTQRLSNMGISISFASVNVTRTRSNRSTSCSSGTGGFNGASCSTSLGASAFSLSSLNTLLTNPTILSTFTGIGTRQGTVRQSGSLFTDETDGDDGFINSRSGNVNASGRLSVTYDYSEHPPVPLPAAFWLFASAFSSMFYFRNHI